MTDTIGSDSTWTIAAVQMDCQLGKVQTNLEVVRANLRQAAQLGAKLVLFPECALTGYSFESLEEALPHAQPLPGPTSEILARDCQELQVFAVVGLLERGAQGELFNACVLVGPSGLVARYRKIHLPFMGVDRFATPGDQPFAVHDLGGLRLGLCICYDSSFPESARILTLLGADLIALPTNWPTGARSTACLIAPARALENHIFFAAVNRVGQERGFHFIGHSQLLSPEGEILAGPVGDQPTILLATITPALARAKRVVKVPGKHEVDRVNDRRPDMYGPLCQPNS